MILRLQQSAPRYWFAWRPVRLSDGNVAWLEVCEVSRGYQCGDMPKRKGGSWVKYELANK